MIREKIAEALKEAMRARDETATTTLRTINAAIKQKDIDVARSRGGQQIGDEEVLALLQNLIKSRREAIDLYRRGNRQDLIDKENAEIVMIERFLPKQMSDEETKAAVTQMAGSLGASTIKDMGKVMAALKAKYVGQLDAAKAGAILKEMLSGR